MDKIKRKMGLGRGLSALLPEKPLDVNSSNEIEQIASNELSIDLIDPNPFQPRSNFDPSSLNELKESIQVQGIIQPITVRKQEGNRYLLISGERRLQASKLAGLQKIPAYIIEASDNQMLEMGLIENIQRENLNPVEIANTYQRLLSECHIKQEELGTRVGKDRSTITNYLRLLNLPLFVQQGLKERKLSMGHARALLGITDPVQLEKLVNDIISKDLSVRRVEELVKTVNSKIKSIKNSKKNSVTKVILSDLQDRFSNIFGKKVAVIADDKTKGEIKIPFSSKEDMEEIINKLRK
jgi:ParB family chromosome partitioning protein